IHAGDGTLLTEYATEKRLFVPIDAVPPMLINAYLAAEDKNFYSHPGIDIFGVIRSVFINIGNVLSDRRPVGGSTITQQVAKNFLLSSETTYERKIKEAILSFRMEKAYDKDEILELYMNDVYLGFGSYGVAAAAQNYFGKALDELTLPEMAYLAALLKAPSNYHPIRYPEAALSRRNVVLDLMREAGFISHDQYREAAAAPLDVNLKGGDENYRADYFAEDVRRDLVSQYGESELYGGGLSVHTSLEPKLQTIAERVLRQGLINYDRRYGWRGPLARISVEGDWSRALGDLAIRLGVPTWRTGVVLGFEGDGAVLGFEGGTYGFLPLEEAKWARAANAGGGLGPPITSINQV
ncbi:MAG TPA: transglycosylase domain-containing protein, partial [Sphingomonadales bacterium]|nr:transglycosylase domain-containing protein [Sphingomonadales bacterium]